jgi:hypothetical protein
MIRKSRARKLISIDIKKEIIFKRESGNIIFKLIFLMLYYILPV